MRPGTGKDAFTIERLTGGVAVATVIRIPDLEFAQFVWRQDVGDATRRDKRREGLRICQTVQVEFDRGVLKWISKDNA